jgi:hypothetical protein
MFTARISGPLVEVIVLTTKLTPRRFSSLTLLMRHSSLMDLKYPMAIQVPRQKLRSLALPRNGKDNILNEIRQSDFMYSSSEIVGL